jgi:histone H3/H4
LLAARANKPKLYMNQLAFRKLVMEITHAINPEMRFKASALDCLQEAAEDYVVSVVSVSQ